MKQLSLEPRNRPRIVKISITPHYAIVEAPFLYRTGGKMLRQQGCSLKRAPTFQACDHSVARTRTLTRRVTATARARARARARDTFVVLKPVVNNDELVSPCDYIMRACVCRLCVRARARTFLRIDRTLRDSSLRGRHDTSRISKLATFRDARRRVITRTERTVVLHPISSSEGWEGGENVNERANPTVHPEVDAH